MTDQSTLLASELVSRLLDAIAQRGDLPVFVKDADTDWLLGLTFKEEGDLDDYPDTPCFVLDTDYYP